MGKSALSGGQLWPTIRCQKARFYVERGNGAALFFLECNGIKRAAGRVFLFCRRITRPQLKAKRLAGRNEGSGVCICGGKSGVGQEREVNMGLPERVRAWRELLFQMASQRGQSFGGFVTALSDLLNRKGEVENGGKCSLDRDRSKLLWGNRKVANGFKEACKKNEMMQLERGTERNWPSKAEVSDVSGVNRALGETLEDRRGKKEKKKVLEYLKRGTEGSSLGRENFEVSRLRQESVPAPEKGRSQMNGPVRDLVVEWRKMRDADCHQFHPIKNADTTASAKKVAKRRTRKEISDETEQEPIDAIIFRHRSLLRRQHLQKTKSVAADSEPQL